MVQLLQTYSLAQVLICLSLVLIGGKEFISLIEFFGARFRKLFEAETSQDKTKVSLESLAAKLNDIEKDIKILKESDKDDIRGWLVEKYNYYKAHPDEKIDEFEMDTIEKRFAHYKDEGGNSYISSIVSQLRDRHMKENN